MRVSHIVLPVVLVPNVLGAYLPINRREDKRTTAPSVDEFLKEMRKMRDDKQKSCDESLFYTGGVDAEDAEAYAADEGLLTIEDVTVLDIDKPEKYTEDAGAKAMDNWNAAYGRMGADVETKVAWIMFPNGDRIDPDQNTYKSYWNLQERPNLLEAGIQEIIQISAEDMDEIQQIYPKEIRNAPGTCKWYGETDEQEKCDGQCPSGETKYTESIYGDTPEERCKSGKKVYCCK